MVLFYVQNTTHGTYCYTSHRIKDEAILDIIAK